MSLQQTRDEHDVLNRAYQTKVNHICAQFDHFLKVGTSCVSPKSS